MTVSAQQRSEPTSPASRSGAARGSRPPVAFISWSEDEDRPQEIATALGGEARTYYDLKIVRKPLVPLRYAISAARTIVYLALRRPHAVIAQNPPIFPALIGLAYGGLARAPVVLDSHPSAFKDTGRKTPHTFKAIHSWVARRAVTTLVTVDDLAEVVRKWGARADIVHEAPPRWVVRPAAPLPTRPRFLYIGRFAADEPIAELLAAARLAPEIDILVTGDVRKCPPELLEDVPPNIAFTGFLRGDDYPRAIEAANAIVVLTGRSDAVCRAAHEGVYAERPLIASGTPVMSSLFPYAVPVENDAAGIAEGLRAALQRYSELVASAPDAHALQAERWESQLATLRARIGHSAQVA